ncbi:hypothetical protein AJ88_44620 [Mesorhizobium amorphae CCBAU 01583]|nr:hypothetical protein AJ88_44620 [Mesorhizobium amorphae CCBAU 01583]
MVKVPYCLRITEERQIYEKLLRESELAASPCAPEVLDILSRFTVSTRLAEHSNSPLHTKMRAYDGENLKEVDPRAKSVQEYRDAAGVDEGMTGVSTRFAFKILSQTFNYDTKEVAADPVHLMYILEEAIKREQFPKEAEAAYLEFIKSDSPRVTLSSSATKSRKPISNPTASMARTFSTATSPMRTPGSRTRTTRTPTPARSSTGRSWTTNCPRSKSRQASPIPRTSATRW